jgi:hypothetical protein
MVVFERSNTSGGGVFMAEVICEVTHGLRESERTVAVKDVYGRRQFLRVEEGFITTEDDKAYLPVGVVGIDKSKNVALIELPHESDGGANRLWVHLNELRDLQVPVA